MRRPDIYSILAPYAVAGVLIWQLWRVLWTPALGGESWRIGTVLGLGLGVPFGLAWIVRIRRPGPGDWHPWQYFTAVLLLVATSAATRPLGLPPAAAPVEMIAGTWYFITALVTILSVIVVPGRLLAVTDHLRLGRGRREPPPVARPLTRAAKFKKRR